MTTMKPSAAMSTKRSSTSIICSSQDLDSTKPAASVKIRVETIAHYLQKHSRTIIEKKKAASAAACPLIRGPTEGTTSFNAAAGLQP